MEVIMMASQDDGSDDGLAGSVMRGRIRMKRRVSYSHVLGRIPHLSWATGVTRGSSRSYAALKEGSCRAWSWYIHVVAFA